MIDIPYSGDACRNEEEDGRLREIEVLYAEHLPVGRELTIMNGHLLL